MLVILYKKPTSQKSQEVGNFISALQIRKERLRQTGAISQGHRAEFSYKAGIDNPSLERPRTTPSKRIYGIFVYFDFKIKSPELGKFFELFGRIS
jgi:hypothetical protein